MKKVDIYNIIAKFLGNEASSEELEMLNDWLENKKNIFTFNRFVKVEYATKACMTDFDLHEAKKNINKKLKEVKKERRLAVYKKVAIAASLVLLVTLGVLQFNKKEEIQVVNTNTNVIDVGSSKAILTLGNGNQVSLEKGKIFSTKNINSNGEELLYSDAVEEDSETISYNYLAIPRGGKFTISLPDGTKIWLNSESKIKYPTRFINGKTRYVELLYGEAYFEVSPSFKHDGAAFKVITKFQEVSVLGTEFNVKAYNDENEIATTLVSGSVVVNNGDEKKKLKPNQQSIINKDTNTLQIQEVDASQEISWVKGMFTFNEESLSEMMHVLSRWYNVEVIFETAERKNYIFTGILERTKSIEDVLKLIQATSEGDIQFEIDEKIIIIK